MGGGIQIQRAFCVGTFSLPIYVFFVCVPFEKSWCDMGRFWAEASDTLLGNTSAGNIMIPCSVFPSSGVPSAKNFPLSHRGDLKETVNQIYPLRVSKLARKIVCKLILQQGEPDRVTLCLIFHALKTLLTCFSEYLCLHLLQRSPTTSLGGLRRTRIPLTTP